jgi:mono/diheme cytochrome c family protein
MKGTRRERKEARQRQKRNKKIMWGVGILVLVLLVTAAAMALSSAPSYAIDPSNPQTVALGKEVYDIQCASCHGANLEGEEGYGQESTDGLLKAPPHDETGHTWHHNNTYLIDSIRKGGARLPGNTGTSAMPAYENILSPEEIGAVLAYIQSTWPEEIAAQQASR